jgi:hypothetical protein
LSCALVALVAPRALANVLVVDASGGGNYTQIQPAVDAADDGDTLLIKSGTYAWFAVNNKSIAIVGDAGANVQINGAVRVRSLAPGKTLVLENVSATGISSNDPQTVYGLHLKNNQGRVRVEGCSFVGLSACAYGCGNGVEAIHAESSSDVALTRTTSLGGSGSARQGKLSNYNSGAGLSAQTSTITIYDSTLRGGTGASADPNALGVNGAFGGAGCTVSGSSLFASGSTMLGGDGGGSGYGIPFGGAYAGDGGDGIDLVNGSSAVLLDDIRQGGFGGPAGNGPESFGGYDGVAESGSTFTHLAGASKHMVSPTPVRENSSFQMTFTGASGERVALVVADEADHVLNLPWKGVMLVKAMHPLLSIPVGTIPAGGTLSVPWTALDLGGLPSKLLHVQPVFSDSQGHHTIGNASSVVILSHLY